MAGNLTGVCPWSILPQWAMLPLTFTVSVSWREAVGLIFTRACPAVLCVWSLCPCLSPPGRFYVHMWIWSFSCLIVIIWSCGWQLSCQRQNGLAKPCCDADYWDRKWKLWVGFVFCVLRVSFLSNSVAHWSLHWCKVCCSMFWDVPGVMLSNIQHKLWESIWLLQSARSQPAALAVLLL